MKKHFMTAIMCNEHVHTLGNRKQIVLSAVGCLITNRNDSVLKKEQKM